MEIKYTFHWRKRGGDLREILFRGQRFDNTDWVFGGYLPKTKTICTENTHPNSTEYIDLFIKPETLGQYTGMNDIKNKKIFEGDIVKFKRINALGYTTSRVGEVQYYDELPIFYIYANTGDAWDWVDCEEIEVIGNIHDNPELMENEK